jgi:hypothetical protein
LVGRLAADAYDRPTQALKADPANHVVEVWKGVDTLHSVPCADTAAAATEAERLSHVYCETPEALGRLVGTREQPGRRDARNVRRHWDHEITIASPCTVVLKNRRPSAGKIPR